MIDTIRENHQYIGHYHTGGVPGRNEIDDTQEIYYPAVMKAIVATGYKGFVGQEFVPKRPDALASLKAERPDLRRVASFGTAAGADPQPYFTLDDGASLCEVERR